ncbi:unnamed protein product [Eruca vesicaria subsp. sativa]|uniref:Uncharacterized protein n=1 Tax=Eruca vesicaria subsp. sativa TaxID=29727 RepID=A0ABC8LBG9_ERUVS|nr:unnamed protein product [Eruca vesicaria subsp. sativa]
MTLTLNMADTLTNTSQETDYTYNHPDEDNLSLSLLRINSFDRRRANSSPPQFQSHGSFSSSSTAAAATSPVKRPSPEQKESEEEEPPRRKKLFRSPPPPESKEDEEEEMMSNRLGYKKVPLPNDFDPNRIRSSRVYNRSLSDRFASSCGDRETAPSGNVVASLPPRPRKPVFRRSVSDLTPAAPSMAFLGSSSSREANLANQENFDANKMLYVIKDGVRELDQWCNKLLHYSEAVKQDDTPKEEVESAEEEEEKERKCKEGVKVDRVGEAFVVEINCPCGRNYRTLFSGRDCYYKLL